MTKTTIFLLYDDEQQSKPNLTSGITFIISVIGQQKLFVNSISHIILSEIQNTKSEHDETRHQFCQRKHFDILMTEKYQRQHRYQPYIS